MIKLVAAVVVIGLASCKSSDQNGQAGTSAQPVVATQPNTPAAAAPAQKLTTSKTIDQGIAEIREAAKAKRLTVDLSEVKAAGGRRMVLRAKGKVAECTALRALLADVKSPPDCLVALCRAEGEVLWNQIGANGTWTDVGTTENCD